ncbi:MAG: NAD-binding protein, partial [Verrucomicrobiota bacterium]
LTPLVMVFEERVLRVRFGTQTKEDREPDDLAEEAPVILAGVGRFGNFVARMLMSQKIPVTVIDSDPDHVEFLRKLGIKTFYGDISRHDLLESAGAKKARVLIIAIDNEEEIEKLIETVHKHFPSLKILVRGLSRQHQYDLLEKHEVTRAIHQHAGSATRFAEEALRILGYRAHRAKRVALTFTEHDEAATSAMASLRSEESHYIQYMRTRMDELENQFAADKIDPVEIDHGWDSDQLRDDTEDHGYSEIAPKTKNTDVGESK